MFKAPAISNDRSFALVNRQLSEQRRNGETKDIASSPHHQAPHSPDSIDSGFSSGSSHSATKAQSKLKHSASVDNSINSHHTISSVASEKSLQRSQSLDSGISNITQISDALETKLSPRAKAWLSSAISNASTTSSTSSSDLALNKLTTTLDEGFSKINEKHSLLNSSEKPENVVKNSSKYLEEIKLSLSEIPTKLQHAQIKNHGTESTPSIEHARLKEALDIVAQSLGKADALARNYGNHAYQYSVPDKHSNFALKAHSLFGKPIWDKEHADYVLSFYSLLKTFCEQLSQAQKEIKNHFTDHASIGNSSDSIVSSVAQFIKNSTHPLMLHDDLLSNISKTLNNLDVSDYPEAHKKISQISSKINSLSKDMALTQLDSQLALHHDDTLSHKEKELLSYKRAYENGCNKVLDIEKNLNELATDIETNAKKPSRELSTSLQTCARLFNALNTKYTADRSVYALEAHAIFEAKHLLNSLNKEKPGSKVNTTHSFEIKGGAGFGLPGVPLLKANVLGKVGTTHSETFSADAHGKYSVKSEHSGGVGLEGNASILGASVSGSATANRITSSDYYEAKTPETLSKHLSTKKNDQRTLPQTLLMHPTVQDMHKNCVNLKNVLNKLSGLNKSDPNEPIFATTKTLKGAVGWELIIQDCLNTLKINQNSLQDKFNLHEIAPISTGKTIASIPGTALAQKNPSVVTTFELSVSAGIGTNGAHSYVNQETMPFVGLLPVANLGASATATLTNTLFNGTALKPTHELMSTAHTQNYKASVDIAQKIVSMWNNKSDSASLPEHLENASKLIAEIEQPIAQEKFVNHVNNGCSILKTLEKNFEEFEKKSALLKEVTRENVALHSPYYKENYTKCVKEMAAHQLSRERQLPEMPGGKLGSHAQLEKRTQETIGRIWDTYSSALGMVELGVLGKIPKNSQDPALQAALEQFSTQYTALAKKMAQPNLPLTQDELYRHAAIESPELDEKSAYAVKAEASFSSAVPNLLRGANLATPGANGLTYAAGATKLLDSSISSSYEKTIPIRTNNPFSKTPSHTITISTKMGGLSKEAPQEWLEGAIKKPLAQAAVSFDPNIKKYANAIRSLAAPFTDNTHNISSRKSVEPTSVMQRNIKQILSGKEANQQVSMALTLSDMGEIESITISQKAANDIKLSSPNVLAYSGVGATLTSSTGLSESRTSTIASAIGNSLAANISKLDELERYGIDAAAIEDIRQSFHQSQENTDSAKLKEKLGKFLTALQTDKAVQSQYLDLDAISGVLQNFASQSGSAATFFNQESIENYCQRKKESNLSVKNFSTPTPTPQDFFKTMCESPELVSKRLERLYQTQTINDFLATASKEKIADFFATTNDGMQLLANFILIVNTAKDIKSSYKEIPLSISEFALKVPAQKNSHQPTRQEKMLA